ncbi:thymidylate kinase [Auriscalpium vulgare]|uniref:Thymidylate kinase n=1 Tax=Auriscalpium vulgare TaxID=40419 RepID=A0ACB8R7T2_9AGAM|nr:thymidylate kinase [Auriscalpium vulgare]
MTRGAFIVIEGLDRSGKSTQAAALLARLHAEGIPAALHKFPDRTTPIGQMIDAYLRSEAELDDRAVHLLFSANRWELAAQLNATLAAGTTVLCDRYAFSGAVFSTSKGLPAAWCRAPDAGLPAPDLTLFLDIAPEHARARGGYGAERYENEAMQARVRELFARMGESGDAGMWVTVDAGQAQDAVARDVWTAFEPFARGVEGKVGQLWPNTVQG